MENLMDNNPQPQEIKIEIGEQEADGVYSNFVIVTHTDSEFILDFARLLPGKPKAKIHSRVIMNPRNCKLFLAALQDNLNKYESKFGKVSVQGNVPFMSGNEPQNMQ
jgi:hypothetical protein